MAKNLTTEYTLNALGAGSPIAVLQAASQGAFGNGYQQPGILVGLSAGAVMTYNVEVTGSDVLGNSLITGLWLPLGALGTGTGNTTSYLGALGIVCKAIRVNITNYTSGTLTFQFCQLQPYGG